MGITLQFENRPPITIETAVSPAAQTMMRLSHKLAATAISNPLTSGTYSGTVNCVTADPSGGAPYTGAQTTFNIATYLSPIENMPVTCTGGKPILYSTNYTQIRGVGGGAAGATDTVTNQAIEFETDSANVAVKVLNNNGSALKYRVMVNGQYATSSESTLAGTGNNWISVEGLTGGKNRIRVELNAVSVFQQIVHAQISSVWPVSDSESILCACVGDSYQATGEANSWPHRNLATVFGHATGMRTDAVALAGTGYVTAGSHQAFGAASRIADLQQKNYSVVTVLGSVNDPASVALQTAALACWRAIRAACPNAFIVVYGVPANTTYSVASAAGREVYLSAAFAEWNDPYSVYIPLSTDVNGWKITSDNNRTNITSADTVHLSAAGNIYLATRMADRLRTALSAVNYRNLP